MFFNRFNADTKFRRDLFVGPTFGNQLEYLHLARTQADALLLEQFPCSRPLLIIIVETLGNYWTEKHVPFLDFPNRFGRTWAEVCLIRYPAAPTTVTRSMYSSS